MDTRYRIMRTPKLERIVVRSARSTSLLGSQHSLPCLCALLKILAKMHRVVDRFPCSRNPGPERHEDQSFSVLSSEPLTMLFSPRTATQSTVSVCPANDPTHRLLAKSQIPC